MKISEFNWKGWLITAGSFAIFVVSFSFLMDWKTALAFTTLLFIHEMGHLVLCWRKNALATPPIFIPFIGALIKIDPTKFTAVDEAEVGFGGPLWGSIGAVLCLLIYSAIPSHPNFLLMAGIAALAINLINLIPLRPLDGGRVTQVISGWFRYVGLLMVLALVLLLPPNPGLWLVIGLIIYSQDENGMLFKAVATLLTSLAMFVAFKLSGEIPGMMLMIPAILAYVSLKTSTDIMKARKFKDQLRDEYREYLYGVKRPLPSAWIRLKWLAYYLALGTALTLLMYWIIIAVMGPYAPVD